MTTSETNIWMALPPMMNCVVCNGNFEITARRRKTCCTECAVENKRKLRHARNHRRRKRRYQDDPNFRAQKIERHRLWLLKTRKRYCRACGNDISHLKWKQYCSQACRAQRPHRTCIECSTLIFERRARYCAECKAIIVRQRNRRETLDRYYRKGEREQKLDQRIATFAAVRMFRKLKGIPEKQTLPEYQKPECVICGIRITARYRWITCSKTCDQVRRVEYSRHYYRGESPNRPERPQPDVLRKSYKRQHNHKRRQSENYREKARRLQRTPAYREYRRKKETEWRAIYAAFRKLNLLPTEGPST